MNRLNTISIIAILFGALVNGELANAANSPLGVAIPEPLPVTGGVFGNFFSWVAVLQSNFYRALTESLQRLKEDGTAAWLLIALSFAYGVFHAVGPGHGKAVISSYVLANHQTLRRGIVISMVSAMVQALTAIVLIGVTAVILNLTSIAITQTTRIFEIGSYALIFALGIWLLWTKAIGPIVQKVKSWMNGESKLNVANQFDDESLHSSGSHCCNSHIADPNLIKNGLGLQEFWSIVAAVGLRPCSGALIVLVFALSQGLIWAGILSTFAMGVGTGLTVSVLASFTVGARELTFKFVGSNSLVFIHRSVEIAGAALVFLIGLTLLIASVGWGG